MQLERDSRKLMLEEKLWKILVCSWLHSRYRCYYPGTENRNKNWHCVLCHPCDNDSEIARLFAESLEREIDKEIIKTIAEDIPR